MRCCTYAVYQDCAWISHRCLASGFDKMQMAHVLFHNYPYLCKVKENWHANALKGLGLSDKVKALKDQILVCPGRESREEPECISYLE